VRSAFSKLPALTLGFWIIKIAATTFGETAGDWVSMSLDLGYLIGSVIFAAIFVVLVTGQVRAGRFLPALYWLTIVATTTLGTTLADFADRSLGLGYPGGVSIISLLLIASLAIWYCVEGTVSVSSVTAARAEWLYWGTILFSQTLGTALGDWVADDDDDDDDDGGGMGLGFASGTMIFGCGLAIVLGGYLWTRISRTALFWAAFILTRPLGATLGDLLDQPRADGGLDLGRLQASLILLVFIVAAVALIPQRAARATDGV